MINLHGTLRKIRCRSCRHGEPSERFLSNEGLKCPRCGDRMRPAVVLFGETLDPQAMSKAQAASERTQLFLVLGSSLVVSPANWFPQIAKSHGARLVIVNRDPTPFDELADLVLHETIGEVLSALDARLGA